MEENKLNTNELNNIDDSSEEQDVPEQPNTIESDEVNEILNLEFSGGKINLGSSTCSIQDLVNISLYLKKNFFNNSKGTSGGYVG